MTPHLLQQKSFYLITHVVEHVFILLKNDKIAFVFIPICGIIN